MNNFRTILLWGLLNSILVLTGHGIVLVFFNYFLKGLPFTLSSIPYLCEIMLSGMLLSCYSFFLPALIGSTLMAFLSNKSHMKSIGFLWGLFVGMLVDIPYYLLSITQYSGIKDQSDYYILIVPLFVFCLSGIYIFNHSKMKKTSANNQHKQNITDEFSKNINLNIKPLNISLNMKINKSEPFNSKKFLPILIIIPFLFGFFFCLIISSFIFLSDFSTNTIPDQLWTYRINRKISEKDLIVRQISINRDKKNNINYLDVTVSGKNNRKFFEYPDVVIMVHKSIFEALDTPIFPSQAVDNINVYITDQTIGYYQISIDYETAFLHYLGKSKPGEYIQHWRFGEN